MTNEVVQIIKSKFQCEFDVTETLRQLTYGKQNLSKFWSWGVAKKINFENKALVLKVQARRFKSYVVITLAWNDTYTVSLISSNGNVKKEFTEVYFDMLTETIDDEIEKVAIYEY